jgi:hypothetical protein
LGLSKHVESWRRVSLLKNTVSVVKGFTVKSLGFEANLRDWAQGRVDANVRLPLRIRGSPEPSRRELGNKR